MDFRYEDTIDAYLLGRMTKDEQKEFLNKVEKDEALSKELSVHQEIFDGVTAIGDEGERDEIAAIQVNEADCEPYDEDLQLDNKRINRTYVRYLALAASIAVLVGVSFVLLNQTENKYGALADQFYIKYTEQDRGEPVKTNDLTDEPKKMLLSGIEYYEAKKYKQAILQLEALIGQNDMLYLADAKWYASLSYLQIAKPDKAKILLQEILNDAHTGKKKKQNTAKILNDIENIQAGK